MIQPTLIDLHPNEPRQGLQYYPFAVNPIPDRAAKRPPLPVFPL